MTQKLPHFSSDMLDTMSECKEGYIFIENTDSKHCRWSRNAVDELGLEEGESFEDSQMWKNIIHPEDFEEFDMAYKKLANGKQVQMSNEFRIKVKNDTYVWMHCSGWCVASDDGETTVFTGALSRIDMQSTIDSVTSLRGNYDFRVALADMEQYQDEWTILILGIDEFKEINDLYSYSFGDKVLGVFAQKMSELLPNGVSLYRLDGDGFGLLFPTGNQKEALHYYQMLQETMKVPVDIDGDNISLAVSGGLSIYPKNGRDSEVLYRNARMALRTAKTKGKNQLVVYSDEILANEHFKMKLLGQLRDSVKMGFRDFSLRYQPLVRAVDGELYGCEVLLRWNNPAFPQGVSPYDFIPILEESGLILEVGNWVFESAIKQCAIWGKLMPEFQMSINVSSYQFEDPNFKFFVTDILAEYGVPPTMIILELTESGAILDPKEMQNVFDFIRGQGIKIAFDDFGTGYASLSIFRVLSADELKIDRTFLERLSYDVTDQKIIAQIVNLCHSMNMSVCVEGIETPEIEAIVRQLGPELLQGYYYNKPMTAEEYEEYYFGEQSVVTGPVEEKSAPERDRSMVYAPFRPAQPMSMEDVVDNAHAGIFQVGMDHEFTFLTCNEGYRRMLGYTAKEMDEKFKNRALGFVYPEDAEKVNHEIRRQLSLGDTVTIEFRVVKSDGRPIWIIGTGNVVKSRHGGTSLIIVIIEDDIIKKKNLEIERTYWLNKKILENIPTGIKCVRFDTDFTLDYISPGFLSILGYTLEDIQTLFDGKYINMIYEEDRKLVTNDIVEQLKVSNMVTMHYRTPCKGGKMIWVETVSRLCPPDEDGIQRAYSSVVGITDVAGEHEMTRGLNVSNRYQSAIQQWGDILFEYDFQSGALSYSDNFQTIFGRNCQTTIKEELLLIHEDERKMLLESLDVVHMGKQPQPVEVRMMTHDGQYRWYSLKFTLPERFGDVPVSAIGKISDIDEEKRERDKLLVRTQHDTMTGLLNKGTTEESVRTKLADANEGQQFALYVIDIDDFKKINDKFGHISGDKVICEIALRLKKLFRDGDIVGRVGGDEFLAFIPYVGENEELIAITDRIINGLRKKMILDQKELALSVSIGIACYPYDGTQFYDMFRRADSALYRTKEIGKDAYCFAAK